MDALGRLLNLAVAVWPDSGTETGINLTGTQGVTVVYYQSGGIGSGDLHLSFTNSDANNDNSNNFLISRYFKSTLASSTWTEVDVTPTETLVLAGAASQMFMLAFEFETAALLPGQPVLNFNATVSGATPAYGTALYIAHGLDVQRAPRNLATINA